MTGEEHHTDDAEYRCLQSWTLRPMGREENTQHGPW